MGQPEFNLYWADPDGHWTPERRSMTAEEAVRFAQLFALRPAAQIGIIRCIRITDGGDNCVYEWVYGKGVVFPEPV